MRMASDDVAVKRVALCSAIFAGFAYVGYSILRSAFCTKGSGRDDKGTRKLVKVKKKKKHKGLPDSDAVHRSSQTDLSVPADYAAASPAALHFVPKSVRDRVRELNLKARMFDDQYFARVFKPRSLQSTPWGSPKALSPVGNVRDGYLSRSAENLDSISTTPIGRRRNSSGAPRRFRDREEEGVAYCAAEKCTDDLLLDILDGLYNKARVVTSYEAKCLVTLLGSTSDDLLVKTLTTISNCAAFTVNQDHLCDAGCLPHLRELLSHECPAVRVAATRAVANMAVNERNQRLLQSCVPALLSSATSCEGGRHLRSVSLLCLANLALYDDVHGAFRTSLDDLCDLVETAEGGARLQALKLLVNLSCNVRMVPHLLAAKAPRNLHSLLEASDREVILRVLTYLANVATCAAKRNPTPPRENRAAAPDTLYAFLRANPSRQHLQNVSRALARSSDEDVCFQANRILDVLVR